MEPKMTTTDEPIICKCGHELTEHYNGHGCAARLDDKSECNCILGRSEIYATRIAAQDEMIGKQQNVIRQARDILGETKSLIVSEQLTPERIDEKGVCTCLFCQTIDFLAQTAPLTGEAGK